MAVPLGLLVEQEGCLRMPLSPLLANLEGSTIMIFMFCFYINIHWKRAGLPN